MGVDTKAIIKKGTTILELEEFAKKHFEDVSIFVTSQSNYFQLDFKYKEEKRSMSVFTERIGSPSMALVDYKIDGVLLSLSHWGSSVEIMKIFLREYGGYLDENDCDDKDFYQVNIADFMRSKEYTVKDEFNAEIITNFGREKYDLVIEMFKKYKKLF